MMRRRERGGRLWFTLSMLLAVLPAERSLGEGATTAPGARSLCGSEPWGVLECREMFLEASPETVAMLPVPSTQTVWRFRGMSPDEVLVFLEDCGLPANLWTDLKEKSAWFVSDLETRVVPDEPTLVYLPPEVRARIYALLGRWRENSYQRNPTIVEASDVGAWLSRAGLSETIVDLVGRLVYPLGDELAFSDTPFILGQLENEGAERRFIRAMTRSRALSIKMKLGGATDQEEMMAYWSLDYGYEKSIPMLRSVLQAESTDYLDIAHLLPPVPRKHLFTFPAVPSGQSGRYPDSFWVVFNFFRFEPEEVPAELSAIQDLLESTHRQLVEGEPRFGDAVVLRNGVTGKLQQGAVFIADDIVYTKFGPSIFRPFVMVRIGDLLRRWDRGSPPAVEYWRPESVPGMVEPPTRIEFIGSPGKEKDPPR